MNGDRELLRPDPGKGSRSKNVTKGFTFKVKLDLTDNELEVVLCGGALRYLKRELVKQGVIDKE